MRYAVMTQDGELVDVKSSVHSAVQTASKVASRVRIEGAQELSPGLAGFGEFGAIDPVLAPEFSLRNSGLPRVDIDVAMRMSLREAHSKLVGFFPKTKFEKKTGVTKTVKAFDTPGDLAGNLLGQNYKTAKTQPEHPSPGKPPFVYVQGLTLLPFDKARQLSPSLPMKKGTGLCWGSSPACRDACLLDTGRNPIDPYNEVIKLARTEALLREPVAFVRALVEGLRKSFNYTPEPDKKTGEVIEMENLVRLNVLSDIPWELVCPGIFEVYSGEQFYDYTKVPGRVTPHNYDLTFSYSGVNQQYVNYELLERGRRVAVVFLPPGTADNRKARREADLPKTFLNRPVRDGDYSDARSRDPQGIIIGLRWKASGRGDAFNVDVHDPKFTAFIVPCEERDGVLVAAETGSSTLRTDPDEVSEEID